MARKNHEPIITHTEILNRAIDSVKREIFQWEEQAKAKPAISEQIKAMTAPLYKKLEALESMYIYETGTEY